MPLPQDIRPVFQDIQDTLIRSDAPWIEQSPLSRVKVLWVGRETGTWASLHHWKKGYSAPPHKHLAGAHAFIISGKLQVRDGVLNAGDYVYEPSASFTMRRPRSKTRPTSLSTTARCCSSTRTALPATPTGRSWSDCVRKALRWPRPPNRSPMPDGASLDDLLLRLRGIVGDRGILTDPADTA